MNYNKRGTHMHKYYTTDRLVLRTLPPDEAYKALDYYFRNKDFLVPFEPLRTPAFYTLDNHKRLLTIEEQDMTNLHSLRLWLFRKSDTTYSTPIGNFAFTNIVRGIFQSCFLGYKMDKNFLQQGYMYEALSEGIRILFEEYKLHRIEANIMPTNIPSLELSKKLGFQEEGLAKSYLKVQGKWEDHLHMALLNPNMDT